MDPSTILIFVAALACPIGMGVMMWMMNRQNMDGEQDHPISGHTSQAEHLKTLREQRKLLEQEIAEVEKITMLEARKDALAPGQRPDGGEPPQPAHSTKS